MIERLRRWNEAAESDAVSDILPCNGSRVWARGLAKQRPFAHESELFRAADAVWQALDKEDWQEAFDGHPRIGEGHAKTATEASLKWSAGEQSAAGDAAEVQAALHQGNRLYEERFGRIFLVCATGKSAAEMLAILQSRLGNDPQSELHEAAEQQRRITQLRLRKWLGVPPAGCEDV